MKHSYFIFSFTLVLLLSASVARAQEEGILLQKSENRPLPSLHAAARAALAVSPRFIDQLYRVPNKPLGEEMRTQEETSSAPRPLLQESEGALPTSVLRSFDGASNDDNAAVVGFRVAPPDTDGDVGDSHVVQMINLVTTIYDKNGNVVSGPFPSNALWSGAGGLCESYNQGDPIVLYDEASDRWLVSQFAFNNSFTQFAQCVAVSQTSDPTAGYNRYQFDFSYFPDYPKHGITSESVTLMANLFRPIGPRFWWWGTYVGAIDKQAMYDGQAASLVGFNLGRNEFGFVAGDLDDPAGTAGFVPALFATAMSNSAAFDIWQLDVDWASPGAATVSRKAQIPVSPFDTDLCSASREECIPQPGTTQRLEALSDRLMHRLQIRDFGSYRTMVTAHTIDVGGGRAGIRWYEMRETGGTWALHQEGTYAPDDGLHRWIPSIAMNAGGDLGLGFLVSNGVDTYVSTAVTGQSAAGSGTGVFDAGEAVCVVGGGAQTGTGRAGDYSATAVDPVTDTFWHTNEYVPTSSSAGWATRICEFEVEGGAGTPPAAPSDLVATAASSSRIDLAWSDHAGNETGFEIERAPDGVSFSLLATVGGNTVEYADTGLDAETTYHYRVRAYNAYGTSDYSNTADATTTSSGGSAPAAPSDLVATAASSSRIDLIWEDNAADEEGFEVERSLDGTSFTPLTTVEADVTGYADTGLDAATTYHYRVRAYNAYGTSDYSNTSNATTESGGNEPVSLHVESIVTGTQTLFRDRVRGTATVTILANLGQPVGGAQVAGVFSGDFSETIIGFTNASGVATLVTRRFRVTPVSFSVCVSSVSGLLPYDPADNTDPSYDCGGASRPGATPAGDGKEAFAVEQNYPNPFNPATVVAFNLAEAGHVMLKVYNVLGQEVAVLVDGYREAGAHRVTFDASHLVAGVYLYTIQAAGHTETRRMTLLK